MTTKSRHAIMHILKLKTPIAFYQLDLLKGIKNPKMKKTKIKIHTVWDPQKDQLEAPLIATCNK